MNSVGGLFKAQEYVPPIRQWNSDAIKTWKKRLEDNPNFYVNKPLEVLAVIIRAVELAYSSDQIKFTPRISQIATVLMFINSKRDLRGRLGQIGTGEGKTLISAMLAVFNALRGD